MFEALTPVYLYAAAKEPLGQFPHFVTLLFLQLKLNLQPRVGRNIKFVRSAAVSQDDNEDEACMEVANYPLPSPEHLITNFHLHIQKIIHWGRKINSGLNLASYVLSEKVFR